jgi:hypothetical protein
MTNEEVQKTLAAVAALEAKIAANKAALWRATKAIIDAYGRSDEEERLRQIDKWARLMDKRDRLAEAKRTLLASLPVEVQNRRLLDMAPRRLSHRCVQGERFGMDPMTGHWSMRPCRPGEDQLPDEPADEKGGGQ